MMTPAIELTTMLRPSPLPMMAVIDSVMSFQKSASEVVVTRLLSIDCAEAPVDPVAGVATGAAFVEPVAGICGAKLDEVWIEPEVTRTSARPTRRPAR